MPVYDQENNISYSCYCRQSESNDSQLCDDTNTTLIKYVNNRDTHIEGYCRKALCPLSK